MALVLKDRVKVLSTTTGTGTFTLGSAVAGYQNFSVIGDGNSTYYAIVAQATPDWEVGIGTYTASGTLLSRDTILESSNGGTAVDFPAGTKDVFVTYPAERSVYLDSAGSYPVQNTFDTLNAANAVLTAGTISTAPTSSTDIANKSYVDTIAAAGISYHAPVRVESPTPLNATYNNGTSGVGATLTNAGTQAALVIDGITVSVNDRVLVYTQTNATQNGVYVVTDTGSVSTNWVLTRSTDTDSYAPNDPNALGQGDGFYVTSGNTGAGELYVCNTVGTITFGTTNITFTQVSSAQVYSAGTGLTLTGTTFSITDTGTAGTYGSASNVPVFTTNAQGQVTSVTNTAIAIAAGAVSGLAASATTDTTNASNITSGTLGTGRLSGSYTNVTGVGTLTAGTWNASTIGAAYGGTGFSSYTAGDLLYADTSSTLAKLADVAVGNALISGGVAANPSWGKIGLATHVDGVLPIANGGTNATTAAAALTSLGAYPATNPNGYTSNTGTVTSVGGTGSVNGITLTGTVTSTGSLTLGGALSGVSLTTQVTGTLPVANGGTGASTLTANAVLVGNGTSAVQSVAPGTSGNVLTSNGTAWTSAAVPLPAEIKTPTNVSPANSATNIGETPTLTGSEYGSLYGITKAAAQWQVSTVSNFATTVISTGDVAGTGVTYNVASGVLSPNTTYYWRVRYKDANGVYSEWSTGTSFTTATDFNNFIPTPAATPAIGASFEGGFYTGLIWNQVTQSATSTAIGTGSKVFTVTDTAPLFYSGQAVEIRSRANPSTNRMIGTVTGSSGTTLTVNVTSVNGSGTYTDWSVMAKYRVIVAPKSSGESSSTQWKNANTAGPSATGTLTEGLKSTLAMAAAGNSTVYPAAHFCNDLVIGGYSDWYLPARDELELIWRNLKPTVDNNYTTADRPTGATIDYKNLGSLGDTANTHGTNNNSSPQGAAYTTTVPGQTSVAAFKTGGAEAMTYGTNYYWSSTEYSTTNAWSQYYISSFPGAQYSFGKVNPLSVRAVRRSIV